MLSATALEEAPWPTRFDVPSEGREACLFSELMSSRAREKASLAAETDSREKGEELRRELSFLAAQWRRREVANGIARLGSNPLPRIGEKIAARLVALRSMLEEEEGPESDISIESLRALRLFMRAAGNVQPPEITLTPGAELYLRWKCGRDHLFAVHLVNGGMVRYAIFAPNPGRPRHVRRLSGIDAADTVLEIAELIAESVEEVHPVGRDRPTRPGPARAVDLR